MKENGKKKTSELSEKENKSLKKFLSRENALSYVCRPSRYFFSSSQFRDSGKSLRNT
jgi:hypothetical protein